MAPSQPACGPSLMVTCSGLTVPTTVPSGRFSAWPTSRLVPRSGGVCQAHAQESSGSNQRTNDHWKARPRVSGDTPGKPVGQPDDTGLWQQGQASQQWRVAPDLLEEQIDKEELPVESKVQQ
jgi:hypothetical protein